MSIWQIVAACMFIGSLVLMQLYRMTRGFRHYADRPSQQATWQSLWPMEIHQQLLEKIMEAVCRAFMFPQAAKWCFMPEDRLADILAHTDGKHSDHLQYDILFVALGDLGLKQRPDFDQITMQELVASVVADHVI